MTKHYSPNRRDAYVSAERKRKAMRQERTLARASKTRARTIVGWDQVLLRRNIQP